MLSLIRKMFRDILKNKVQFASVFLMALLGIMIYTGIEGVWLGMRINSDKFNNDSKAITEWVYGKELTNSDLTNLLALDYVEDGILSMQFDCLYKVKEDDDEKEYNLQVNTFDHTNINIPKITEGLSISTNGDDVCWIDDNYAKEHGIAVGDQIRLRYLTTEYEVKVVGKVISPEYTSYTGSKTTLNPNHMLYGYCYLNEETTKKLLGFVQYNVIKLVTDNYDNEKANQDYANILGGRYAITYSRNNYQGVQAFFTQINQLKSMSFMFSAIFILISLLSMQTTMKRLVETQRTQIGTLKALGFTNFQILTHYASYGFIISAIGCLVGFLIGPKLITPILINVQKDFYTLPQWSGENSILSYVIIGITILSCTLITLVACQESIHLVPAEAMRNKQIEIKDSESGKAISNLSFEWKWSIRYILRNKMRTVIGVIGVVGCLVLLMASIGLYDSLKYANQYLYGTQYQYENRIVFDATINEKNIKLVKDKLMQDYQQIEEQVIQIKTVDTIYPSTISAIDKGYYVSFYKNIMKRNKKIVLDNKTVLISKKLAEKLNIIEGQTIKIKLVQHCLNICELNC